MLEESRIATNTWRVSPDLMCIIDRDGCFAAVNPAWTATLGWAEDEIVGQPYLHFLHAGDVDRSNGAFEEVKSGKPVLRFENRYRTTDGDYRWFSWVAVPEGEHFYCIVRDVTDEKQRDEVIQAQRDEAMLREQFLAVLGHDLRNPLSSVISGVNLLLREEQSERSLQVLRHMQASGARMAELVTNMMDFARVRLGDGIGLERAVIPDFAGEAAEIVQEIQTAFDGTVIELTTDIRGEVYCDGPRIMQVLSNLLGNAVTHGDPGDPIQVDAVFSDGRLKISVCNSGQPIPASSLDTLYQPFFKGGSQSSPHGLGLGLFISSEIVSAHGGEIGVTCDEDIVCFNVDIPARKPGAGR
ncbi:PAS domain-containing sensor histidine kinase [Thalassobaculum litoreum]|uniref:histidine kinase n=1 Tax=Thalassobaculum litoreum DSM 18839 TaxID=1123362 RepID=A0A8G2BDS9_9PROT|nr:PAS domain-containing sensor histidine kinase [Thalassobaculum litoreum]SDF04675.1 His Kinase A (phospho-acceptor) domain-containing protein [Thalassobaculum litoreum DSM 18839]